MFFVSLYMPLNTDNSKGFRRFGTDFLQILFRKIKTRKSPVNTEIARKKPEFIAYPPYAIPRIFAREGAAVFGTKAVEITWALGQGQLYTLRRQKMMPILDWCHPP